MEKRRRLNPAFERVIAVSKNTGKSVSDLLEIDDRLGAFCIDEAAQYIYYKIIEQQKNKKEMDNLMRYSVKKGKK